MRIFERSVCIAKRLIDEEGESVVGQGYFEMNRCRYGYIVVDIYPGYSAVVRRVVKEAG